jgi:hypothetical protein
MKNWIILAALGAGGYYLWKKREGEVQKPCPKVKELSTPTVGALQGSSIPLTGVSQTQMTLHPPKGNNLKGISTVFRDLSVKRGSTILFTLPSDARDVTVVIYNAYGETIRQHVIGGLKAGERKWFWDGRNDTGETVGPGTYYSMVTCEYGKLPIGKVPVGGVYGCLENLVREGWDLQYAARQCNFEVPAEALEPEMRKCIVNMIREAASFGVALNGCKGLVYGPPTPTKPPEPTPSIETPLLDDFPLWLPLNGEVPPEEKKAFPDWIWAVAALGGLLLFSRR